MPRSRRASSRARSKNPATPRCREAFSTPRTTPSKRGRPRLPRTRRRTIRSHRPERPAAKGSAWRKRRQLPVPATESGWAVFARWDRTFAWSELEIDEGSGGRRRHQQQNGHGRRKTDDLEQRTEFAHHVAEGL